MSIQMFNKSLWIDEGYSNITSLLISQTGKPLYESGYWDGAYLLFHYLQAGMFYIFGYSPEISRILPFIFGVISLYFIYRIADFIFGKYAGLISVTLCVFSYQYLTMHLQARYYGLMTLLFIVTIWQLINLMNKFSWLRIYILLTLIVLSFSFHAYLYSLIPIAFFGIILEYGIGISKIRNGGALIFIKHNWRKILTLLSYGILILLLGYYLNPGVLPSNVSNTIALSQYDYAVKYAWFFRTEFGLLGIAFFGTLLFWQKFQKWKFILLLGFTFLFPYLVIAKQVFMVANRYVYFLIPIFVIIAAGFFVLSVNSFEKNRIKILLTIIYSIGILFTFNSWIGHSFPLTMNDRFAPEPDYKSAYKYILNSFDIQAINIISSFPHMDKLYLGRSDGYIYIDETGTGILPENNFYIRKNRSIFTNARVIMHPSDLNNYLGKNIIIFDQLSYNRLLNSELLKYIEKKGNLIYFKENDGFFVKIYSYEK